MIQSRRSPDCKRPHVHRLHSRRPTVATKGIEYEPSDESAPLSQSRLQITLEANSSPRKVTVGLFEKTAGPPPKDSRQHFARCVIANRTRRINIKKVRRFVHGVDSRVLKSTPLRSLRREKYEAIKYFNLWPSKRKSSTERRFFQPRLADEAQTFVHRSIAFLRKSTHWCSR